MKLDDGIKYALNGDALLFVGAGFSTGATNILNATMPSGRDLINILSSSLDETEDDLEILSESFIEKYGEHALISLLIENFTCKSIDSGISTICSIPWQTIYTTNFDNVLEFSLSNSEKKFSVATTDSQRPNYRSGSQNRIDCVHINGSVLNLSVEGLKRDVRLTSTSYLTTSFQTSPWSIKFRADLKRARSVFFIGYSLFDIDIRKLLYQYEELVDKCFFINGIIGSKSRVDMFSKYGIVTGLTVNNFSEKIIDVEKTFRKSDIPELFDCFEKIQQNSNIEHHRDTDVFNLLFKGEIRSDFFHSDAARQENIKPYTIERSVEHSLLDSINNNKFVHIHGGLGNGKTILVNRLAEKLLSSGYDVYYMKNPVISSSIASELGSLQTFSANSIVIIEDFYRIRGDFDILFGGRHENIKFLLTSRTSNHEIFSNELYDVVDNIDNYVEYDVNKMSQRDADRLDNYLESYGLWDKEAGSSKERRVKQIETVHGGEFQSILVRVIKSEFIKKNLSDLFLSEEIDDRSRKVIILFYTLMNVGQQSVLDPHVLSEVSGEDVFSIAKSSQNNLVFREFLEVRHSQILTRSPVFAKVFIESLTSSQKFFLDNVISMLSRIDSMGRYDINPVYWDIFVNMSKFSVIEPLISNRNKREFLIYFYENLSRLENCKQNDHFWLHYAMARMALHDYDLADKYLMTAESLSKRRGIDDDFQIQNQKARARLMRCIHTDIIDASSVFREFLEAHRVFRNQMVKEPNRVQPFRWTALYSDFHEKYANSLNDQQKELIKKASLQVIASIDRSDENIRNSGIANVVKNKLVSIL